MLTLTLLAIAALARPDDTLPEAQVDSARLLANLQELPTQRAALGDADSQQGLIKTEELLTKQLQELGYKPTVEALVWNRKYQAEQEAKLLQPEDRPEAPTDDLAGHIWHNLIAEIPGKDIPKEVLILSCHFDAARNAPGADDDGTGVTALLEIARVLKDRPMRRTVRLIFFNLEEVGLKGSMEYVQAHKGAGERVIGMVSLEMLGYYSDKPNSQKSPIPKIEGVFDPPTVGDFIGLGTISKFQEFSQRFNKEMLASAPGIKIVVADFMPIAPPDFLRSDHAPFMRVGIPGVILTDTSNFRNPNYHKPTDTIDTLDQPRLTLTVRAVAGATYRIAEPVAPPPP